MTRRKPVWQIVPLLLTILLLGAIRPASAQQSERHAGLVLQFADGSTKTYCVAFAEESVSGLDLLLRTNLEIRVESFGGAGSLICKIGPDGCDFPEEACVCESYGPGGVYWSYHHLKEGSWKTSGVGISSYRLRDGDVDGLAWSAGKPPPLFTFSQICASVGAQPPTQAEPTATRRLPLPVPTNRLPTFTPELLQPELTREPTFQSTPQPPTVRPSSTRQTITQTAIPSRTPRPSATVTLRATAKVSNTVRPTLPAATSTFEVQLPTATTALTSSPAPTNSSTPAPTSTATPQPTTPVPSSTDTTVPTRAASTPTPILAVIDARSDTGEEMARNIGLAIGGATLAGLVGWGIWRGRRRRKRGQDVG